MDRYRNPFAIRASEKIESDETFIQLFSSEPLSFLLKKAENDKLWNNVNYILSSPGGGKTTLLRLFSPTVLKRITERNRDLFNKVKKLEVKDQNHIYKCGAYLQIGRDYAFLEDDDLFNKVEQQRIFFALLNARIVLVSLKSLMLLAGIKYNELDKIKYTPSEHFIEFDGLYPSCTAKDLLNWASGIEKQIHGLLDSFERRELTVKGNSSLFALSAMKGEWFTYSDNVLCKEFIFQFDDAHKFTSKQKELIREEVISRRVKGTLWIAERLEALTTTEILDDTNYEERDYENIILDGKIPKSSFASMAKAIATRRSKYSLSDVELMEALSNDLYKDYSNEYNKAADRYQKKISKTETVNYYSSWIDEIKSMDSARERAVWLRALLMYISRRKESHDVFQIFPFTPEEMKGILNDCYLQSEQIIAAEIGMPQYYGGQTLIDLASANVEQFLSFSSKLYDRLLSNKIINPLQYDLSAEDQHKIIVNECSRKFNEIKKLPEGDVLMSFISHVIEFCRKETFTDSYSYRTVTGFAILEENALVYGSRKGRWFVDDNNVKISEVLRLCLAYNLLERISSTQGKKEQEWSVFYLNRWLCAYANLPLYKGGWRKLPLSKVTEWINK